jgi:hypothetical protein
MSKEQNVYHLISKVQGELAKAGISKDHKNAQQNYAFRGIDDVYNTLSPLLASSGLCIIPAVLEREVVERTTKSGTALFYVTVKVRFDFVSSHDGSKHEVVMFGEAMDSGDKATNKALSAAYKYACLQTFSIPTEGDNDADATTHSDIVAAAKSVFKNAALRKQFFENVLAAYQAADTVKALNETVEMYRPKFEELRASGNEHDELAVDELSKRYKQRLSVIKDSQYQAEQEAIFQAGMPEEIRGVQ